MTGNGLDKDEGLMAIRLAFKDAQYLNADGKECANMMMLGAHRDQKIPDNLIMEIYGGITEGKNMQVQFVASDSGNGYIAHIESYDDLLRLMSGKLQASLIMETVVGH